MATLSDIADALIAAIDGATGLESVVVCEKSPDPREPKEAIVFTGLKSKREYRGMGGSPNPLDESFSATFSAVVYKSSTKASTSTWSVIRARAYELVELAEVALRADLHLEPLHIFFLRVASTDLVLEPVDKGRAASVSFVVEGKARI